MTGSPPDEILDKIRRTLDLTYLGLWAERLSAAFWPLWSLALAYMAAFALGGVGALIWAFEGSAFGNAALIVIAGGAVGAVLGAALRGALRFKIPRKQDALERLDAHLPGRPLAALCDAPAVGSNDPASQELWAQHMLNMAQTARRARPIAPNLRLARFDPFALRYAALCAFVIAALFGAWGQERSAFMNAAKSAATRPALPSGPAWEGWASPPAYTGRPRVYLNDPENEALTLPIGTRFQFRLYGADNEGLLRQNVSARDSLSSDNGVVEFALQRSGTINIDDARQWTITALPDLPPRVALDGKMRRNDDGSFSQNVRSTDDYGVGGGTMRIALDLSAVPRRHGLAAPPEHHEDLIIDLPLGRRLIGGQEGQVTQRSVLKRDLSRHLFANMPVTLSVMVRDAAGQEARSAPISAILPARRFLDDFAAALIEMRRDVLWSSQNVTRSARILRALIYEGRAETPLNAQNSTEAENPLKERLISVIDLLERPEAEQNRPEVADALWEIAVEIEDSSPGNALARLERAQQRLEEALRRGFTPSEIEPLMRDYQNTLRDYLRSLAEQGTTGQGAAPSGDGLSLSQNDIQQMLEKLRRLIEEGRLQDAQELMEALRNLRPDLNGSGAGSGQGSLNDALREQQNLSDDLFRQFQETPPKGGTNGEATDGENGDDLADAQARQRALRERLDHIQRGTLPNDGRAEGEAGRDALTRSENAMREAEQALEDADIPRALRQQARAAQDLRRALNSFSGEHDESAAQTDPLGRDTAGEEDDSALGGTDLRSQRAEALLEEIRRRAAQPSRPQKERDYLNRLLKQF